ncbi:hypothetical protein [uncultured Agrobacterium sp.]|uniref:hypothetical protein n=1 Tax=uncultured Agrobacterium sp. TaxID=157277 RepID=UPI0025D321BF|nr:hypothetical protein [uncultured Agrobacterium sp.]
MRKWLCALVLSWPGGVFADDAALLKFRDFLPAQIASMSEDERKQSVPMAYLMATNLALSEFGSDVLQAQLNSLLYDGLADFEGAKRAFQTDLGQVVTGDLTVGQINELSYRSERIKLQPVNFFSYGYSHSINENYAALRGTVQIIDEKIAYPVNYVTVKCHKAEGYCSYNQVALTLPDRNSWAQTYSVMEVADEFYKITRWEGKQIDATPFTVNRCRTNRLTFNFESEEFFEVATNNSARDCETELGVTIPRLQQPRVSKIIDGTQLMNAEFQRIQDEASGYYASAFRQRLQQKSAKGGRVTQAPTP